MPIKIKCSGKGEICIIATAVVMQILSGQVTGYFFGGNNMIMGVMD